jgi:hypothetical protein
MLTARTAAQPLLLLALDRFFDTPTERWEDRACG